MATTKIGDAPAVLSDEQEQEISERVLSHLRDRGPVEWAKLLCDVLDLEYATGEFIAFMVPFWKILIDLKDRGRLIVNQVELADSIEVNGKRYPYPVNSLWARLPEQQLSFSCPSCVDGGEWVDARTDQ